MTSRLGGREVLRDVNLEHGSGVVGLLGVNGAGKTTLLDVAAGLRRPTEGVARVGGEDLYGSRAAHARSLVGLVPQEVRFPPRLRLAEFLRYLAWLKAVDDRTSAVAAALDAVGLSDRADSPLRTLSGGMRRRALIAQALLTRPPVLLLDEPTTGLDAEQRAGLREMVATLACERTVVMASHLIEDVDQLARRIVVLDEGSIAFDGTPADLRAADPVDGTSVERGFLAVRRTRSQC